MRIVLSFLPAEMFSRRCAEWRLARSAMRTGAFAGLEAGVHQTRFKCLVLLAVFALFRRSILPDASVASVSNAFAAANLA